MDIVELGASVIRKGVALWSGVNRIGDAPNDVEPLPDGEVFQGLGLASLPYPATDDGFVEGVCVRGAGGRDVTWLGARDTRTGTIVGNLRPGDTCVHSTGPQQAAQLQCKEKNRQVLMATKDGNGKTMLCMLDGSSGKFQLVLSGMIVELDSGSKNITISNGQASIFMQGSTIALDGDVVLGGKVGDPVNNIMTAPGVGGPGTSLAFVAARGVKPAVG